VLPNDRPLLVQLTIGVSYLRSGIFPLPAVTSGNAAQQIQEILDMHLAWALLFTS
jgi:hypothetical protein